MNATIRIKRPGETITATKHKGNVYRINHGSQAGQLALRTGSELWLLKRGGKSIFVDSFGNHVVFEIIG